MAENKIRQYVIIIKALEDGKFKLRFPDFEELEYTVHNEANINTIAEKLIRNKLEIMELEEIEIPEPLSAFDIKDKLELGDITNIIEIKPKLALKGLDSMSFKGLENLNLSGNIIKIVNLVGGGIFLLAAMLPMVGMNLPMVGPFRFGLFTFQAMKLLENFGGFLDEKLLMAAFAIRFLSLMGIILAGYFIYVNIKEVKSEIPRSKISLAVIWGIDVIFMILLGFQAPKDIRGFIGWSFAEYFMLISLMILYSLEAIEFIKKRGEKKNA